MRPEAAYKDDASSEKYTSLIEGVGSYVVERLKESTEAQHKKQYSHVKSSRESNSLLQVSLKKYIKSSQEDGEGPKNQEETVKTKAPSSN